MTRPHESQPDKRRSVLRAVGVLVGGTAFGHVITAAALPVATRLYSPADFSVLALFASIVGIVGAAACLRFDIAIPIPEEDSDAVGLLALAMTAALSVCTISAALLYLFADKIKEASKQQAMASDLWLLPLGIFAVASYAALQGFLVREKSFDVLAKARVIQAAASASAQLGLGWIGVGTFGLLLANVLYGGGSSPWLAWSALKTHGRIVRQLTWLHMRTLARNYRRFPQFSTLEALANSASIQLPVILIAAWAVGPEAGYLLLAMQVMQVPMAVIGNAVGQVYLSQAPAANREGRIGKFTAGVVGSLALAGIGPLLFAAIVAPVAFPILFGAPWARAGWLVSWMTPWFIMQFLASPVSMALHITGRQQTALALQVVGLIVRVLAVIVASRVSPNLIGEAYALSGLIFYAAYLATVLRVSGVRFADLTIGAGRTLMIALLWSVAGLLSAWAVDTFLR